MLRHIVLFAFKPTSTAAEVESICTHFLRLPQEIDLIRGFEWGLDVSPEGLQRGLTHCFLLTFDNAADRDAYLIHPAHQAFVAAGSAHFAQALVVDYFADPVLHQESPT